MRAYVFAFVACGLAVASPAFAQGGFDDEFEDEFSGSSSAPAPAPRQAPAAPAAGRDDDSEFGDVEESAPATEAAGGEAPAAEASSEATSSEEEAADEEPAPAPEADAERRARLFRSHNTYLGPTGGIRVLDAGSGPRGTFRVGLIADFFYTKNFLNRGDNADHVGGSLSLSWTAWDYLEVFASVQSYANSNDQGDPALFQVLGDAHVGLKGFYWVTPFLAVGGDADVHVLNTVGDIGLVLESTSIGLRGNLTADFRGLPSPIPFIVRFNAQYYFDQSAKLVNGVEDRRYDALVDPLPREDETRHLITRIERFGLQIDRTDFVNLSLGLEVPIKAMTDFYISPIVEWTWALPVNRQGYDCVFIPAAGTPGSPAVGDDGCLARQGPKSFPMELTLGVRLLPPVPGLALLVGADIGLTGTSTFVREVAPTAPYQILLGASYAYDGRRPVQPTREVVREVEAPRPLTGRIHGVVIEEGTETTITDAIVRFPGRDLTGLISGAEGKFITYEFDPGQVDLEITHPEYHPGQCSVTIPNERPAATEPIVPALNPYYYVAPGTAEIIAQLRCELRALPRMGQVNAHVVSDAGAGVVGAQVELRGPTSRDLTTDASGHFAAQDLPPGTYTAQIIAEGYLVRAESIEIVARETAQPEITLIMKPRRSLVRMTRREIRIRRQINFATNNAEILPSSDALMAEIADVMIRHPDLAVIEIQGHTDDRGAREPNRDLSQRRADAVRDWLIHHGVDSSRLRSTGFGPDRPLVPNITASNRARNRRVQFVIVERAQATE